MAAYTIRQATEADIPQITELVIKAMHDDAFDKSLFTPSNPTTRNQPSDAAIATALSHRRTWMTDLWSRQLARPDAHMLIAYPSSDAAEIAGFACWDHTKSTPSSTTESAAKDAMGATLPVGMSAAAHDECVSKLEAAKAVALKPCASKACWHLTMLAVSTQHARRGVGTLLFEWAARRADAEGAVVYLEATPVGIGLYERFGCVRIARVEFSVGGERVVMLREPSAKV